jgi:hypothetical protein
MSGKLLELIEGAISRRSFVRKVSAVTTAFVSGVLFPGNPARASGGYKEACCSLCFNPIFCVYTNCTCEWGWNCCHGLVGGCQPDPKKYRCYECIETPMGGCVDNPCQAHWECGAKAQCPGVKCSKVVPIPGETCPGQPC